MRGRRCSRNTAVRNTLRFLRARGLKGISEHEIGLAEDGYDSWSWLVDPDFYVQFGIRPHHEECPIGYVHHDGLIEGPYAWVDFDRDFVGSPAPEPLQYVPSKPLGHSVVSFIADAGLHVYPHRWCVVDSLLASNHIADGDI